MARVYEKAFVSVLYTYLFNCAFCALMSLTHLIFLTLSFAPKSYRDANTTTTTSATHTTQDTIRGGDGVPISSLLSRLNSRKARKARRRQYGISTYLATEDLFMRLKRFQSDSGSISWGKKGSNLAGGLMMRHSDSSCDSNFFHQVHGSRLFRSTNRPIRMLRSISEEEGVGSKPRASNLWDV